MTHLGLFEGIGGFSLAARWMGWETLAWCEWNEFGQKVLKHHFPEAEGFGDITQTDFTRYANRIDILTGGFPCQPYSLAGKRKGKEDSRHLWPEMLRAIREVKPKWVIGENVFGLINWDGGLVHHEVQADLEAEGYEVFSVVLPAASVGAPHRRDRVWFVAHSKRDANGLRTEGRMEMDRDVLDRRKRQEKANRFNHKRKDATNANSNGQQRSNCEYEKQPSERRFNALNDFEQVHDEESIIEYTNSIGQEYALEIRELERRRFRQSYQRNIWYSFPSQSPLCGGNDGLSYGLDGITFSKWRQESIKAYGNAIVPQVAFELFKVVQQIEEKKIPLMYESKLQKRV